MLLHHLLHALGYLHGLGVVHRDIKAENVMLRRADDPVDVVLTDFGLGTFAAPHERAMGRVGTAKFIAPEIFF